MPKLYLDRNLQYVFGVTLMAILGVSSIIPALPDIMEGLRFTPSTIGLAISVFTLPGVLLSPVVGILADRVGRKKVLIPSLFLFGVAGFLCFFARSIETLLALRFIQGMGAAPLGVLYGTIIGDLYSGRDRGAAMGYNAAVLSMGTAFFPALGGALAMLGWNWPFLLPLLAIPLGVVIMMGLETPEPKNKEALADYMKAAFRQMRTRRALTLFATTFLTFIILYGPIVTYLPILLDQRFHSSPATIGMIFLAASLMTALASFQLGRLADKFGQRTLLAAGAVFYALCMIGVPNMPGFWSTILPVTCFGIAQGLNIPTVMTMLTSIAPMEQRGAFMAANGMLLRLSQTVAPMVMGGVYALFGLEAVFLTGLACAAAIFLLAVLAIK
ncbi:MFS transporter [Salidesulfovibrio onnuriiensis]|uniref:MFS transporter n=1 Tax=Salidesulfovibrio onnuriiensis TaxID=2583823 RepID=UPI0011CB1C67|nr:MFS transporter [Salidesulfovibrio onnuriiensis]